VQAPIYDAFAVRLAKAVAGLTVGDGRDEGTRIGPLIDGAARRRICGLIDSAVSGGARIMTGGGGAPVPGGQFLAPTVLSGVSHDMEIARTEIFGPVAPLIRFDTESEAIALANDSIHGLAAYVFDRDPDRLVRVTEALEAGMIGVNTGQISTELAPFGGVKQSGLGREGGQPGIEDYLELKFLCAQVQDA